MKTVKTYSVKGSTIAHQWRVIDAAGQTLGRLASQVAQVLRGKDKPIYTPHLPVGDYVVVINAVKMRVSGKKLETKLYRWHTGHPGGLRERTLEQMLAQHPERVIQRAVKGMLPRGPLGNKLLTMLKVYPGPEHPHQAQVVGGMKPQSEIVAALRARRDKVAAAAVPVPQAAVAAASAPEAPTTPTPTPGRPARRQVRTLAEREATRPARRRAPEAEAATPLPQGPDTGAEAKLAESQASDAPKGEEQP